MTGGKKANDLLGRMFVKDVIDKGLPGLIQKNP